MKSADRRRSVAELVFLHSGPIALRAAIVLVLAMASGAAGNVLYRLQVDFATRVASGESLNGVAALLAQGSSVRTAWIGWAAAVFFLIAAIRVRRGPTEPSPGRKRPEQLSAAQLRSGLRREYAAVRLLLVVVLLITAVDAARALTLLAATSGRSLTLGATIVEAGGLAAASATLAAWAWWFGDDVRRLGAV